MSDPSILKLPPIYPITSREHSGLSHPEQVRLLAAAGCRFVQIREKTASSREFYDSVVESLEIAREFEMKVIVNDRVDIAIAAGAHGVHLGQDDLSPEAARELLGDDSIIGFSTHSVKQAIEAAVMPIDYLAIGPVFATSTKQDPDPIVGLEGIRKVRKAIRNIPLVAIGGIEAANITEVFAAGADSAAVISYLFKDPNEIARRFRSLADICERVKQD